MLKRSITWFLLLVPVWLTLCGLLSSNEPDTDGFLNFGFPLTVFTDFNNQNTEDPLYQVHQLNLAITLAGLLLVSVAMAYMIKSPLSFLLEKK